MRNLEAPPAAAAVLEFAVDRWPDFNVLRIGLAVELVVAGEVEEARRLLRWRSGGIRNSASLPPIIRGLRAIR